MLSSVNVDADSALAGGIIVAWGWGAVCRLTRGNAQEHWRLCLFGTVSETLLGVNRNWKPSGQTVSS